MPKIEPLSSTLEASMKKAVLFSAMGALAAWGSIASAQEYGRVISSTPVVQQVPVPRQVCNNQPMVVQQAPSGGGAAVGGIVGGVLGNQFGHGSGRAAATLLGALGGAAVGNNLEAANSTQLQNVPQCTTQTTYENRTVAYNVAYEYGGKQYHVQMPNDPGPTIALQVTPAATAQAPADNGYAEPYGQPGQAVGVVVGQPPPVAVYPSYPVYYPSYYPPVGVSLGLGFFGGRHWR
jgi:uncharacterized protein YcfJ